MNREYRWTPSEPHEFPRRVLLVVTGLSPQVVTETLHALAVVRRPPFVPTEVFLITTREGAERARLTLLSEEPGWFARLRSDYRLDGIRFDDRCISVLDDASGRPLEDIRDGADNTCAANAITERIRGLTAEPDVALHVSIAGGRKTMGFYAGYALSLFGRPQDRLSHVLVSPPFESHQDFFYPTPYSRIIYSPPPDSRPLDTRDAVVSLAEIPFVRLRHGLPRELLDGRATFGQAVEAAQVALGPPELVLELKARRVRAGGRVIRIPPAELAFLAWMARRRAQDEPPLPCPPDGSFEPAYAQAFLAEYRAIAGPDADTERTERALRSGMDKAYFESHKSKLNRRIELGLGAASPPYLVRGFGSRPATSYGLDLPRGAVRFSELAAPESEASKAPRAPASSP